MRVSVVPEMSVLLVIFDEGYFSLLALGKLGVDIADHRKCRPSPKLLSYETRWTVNVYDTNSCKHESNEFVL